MTLPLTDTALIGTCLAASALGLIVLTSSGGNGQTVADANQVQSAQLEAEAAQQEDVLEQLGASAVPGTVSVDAEFGEQVRSYLLQNPEVIFEAVAAFEQRNAEAQADMDRAILEANADALFNDTHSWVGGNPEGDITLVEFLDYRCGFCKRAHDEVLELLEADSGIRLIIKEFPILGPESELSSRFAIASLRLGGDDIYEQVNDTLIRHDGPVTPDYLDDLAGDLGLDFEAVVAEMESEEVGNILAENRALAQRLQISGTPTFVMETEMIRGFVEADVLIETADFLRN
ncbi:DsbA family protein [Roseinatronobacter bogoriensis]|uniref:Disulfide bond formation protein DsbA n=1 Tax=Roseinatronobacter bogoriensis subsp. barguzinensis TaxID=441209 RepID=A0A2K8KEM3_9RHOB|nr:MULTISPECIES: DsbA family protein [Rhodobaca]ATX66195.1 disulfide bond formation protein DsbA [Rhodobaca barguzinensis]MBB4207301.1 protein-disulfide isomerase [Rhodobaca bogoriensis DSM 18756]TDW40393.1 protein-disulfide isomerase [Rhodobaca barguzinensis]TDY70455.1 protein-disulfide isomerase [Rhodobaca bogoriensis DSM 18756]